MNIFREKIHELSAQLVLSSPEVDSRCMKTESKSRKEHEYLAFTEDIPNENRQESPRPRKGCESRSLQRIGKFMSPTKETRRDEFAAAERKGITYETHAISVHKN